VKSVKNQFNQWFEKVSMLFPFSLIGSTAFIPKATSSHLMDPAWTVLQTGIPGVAPECTGSVPMSGASGFIRMAVE